MQLSLANLSYHPQFAALAPLLSQAAAGGALNPMSLAALSASSAASPGSVPPRPQPAFTPQSPTMQGNPVPTPAPVASPVPTAAQSLGGLSPRPQSLGDLSPGQGSAPVALNAQPYSPSGVPSLADMVNNLPGADLKKHTNWGKIIGSALGVIGDGLSVYGGKQPLFGPEMARENELKMQQEYEQNRLSQELAERREVALRPRTETAGNTIGTFDPTTSSFTPVYTAPSAAEQYADALGYQPGSDDYKQAVQDYRLGSYSDPAVENRKELTGYRYDRSDAQLGRRLGVQTRGQDLAHADRQATIHQSDTNSARSASTSTANNIRSTGTSAANNAATNHAHLLTARRVNPAAAAAAEPVAVGPNGQRLVVRNGQWVPAQ